LTLILNLIDIVVTNKFFH